MITLEELTSAGVRFICMTQGLDTDNANPMSRAMLGMLQVFAQFERDMINERVNAGIKRYHAEYTAGRARSKSGKNLPIGRPRSVFRMDQAIRMRAEGLSWRTHRQSARRPRSDRSIQVRRKPCRRSRKNGRQTSGLNEAERARR